MKHGHDGTLCAGAGDRPLYQVLEQQQAQVGGNLMGSDHTYIIPGGKPAPGKKCASPLASLMYQATVAHRPCQCLHSSESCVLLIGPACSCSAATGCLADMRGGMTDA